MEGIIERGVFKSLAGSKQFEEIVRKQGGHRKKQGVGYFNVNGDVWEEGPYPTPKFVPQEEKCDSTPSKGTSSQDGLLRQDHKDKGKIQYDIDLLEEEPQAKVKWIPKHTSRTTSSSGTTTPRIPIKLMCIPKRKN